MSFIDESLYAEAAQSFHKSFQPEEVGSFHGRPGSASFLPLEGLPHQRRNVALCGALYATYVALRTGITEVAPLAAAEIFSQLDEKAAWYQPLTLPFACIYISDLILAVPFSYAMQRFGRRPCFMFGGMAASVGFFLSGLTLFMADGHPSQITYWLLSACGLMIGPLSMAEFCKFAAAEAVPKEQQARVLGIVMTGGALNAVMGPAVASLTSMLAPPDHVLLGYAYFYFVCAVFGILFAVMASLLKLPQQELQPQAVASDGSASKPGKLELLSRPGLAAAFVGAFSAQSYMILLMTASPNAMAQMLTLPPGSDWRISGAMAAHLLGMFVPGFFSGGLIAKMGPRRSMNWGDAVALGSVVLALATSLISLPDESSDTLAVLLGFYIFLVPLGVGWHFSFVSASKLLLENQKDSEKAAVQGLNEFLRFLANTISIILAGTLPFETASIVGLPVVIVLSVVKNMLLLVEDRQKKAPIGGSELLVRPAGEIVSKTTE